MAEIVIRKMQPEDRDAVLPYLQELHRAHHRAYPDIFKEELPLPSPKQFAERLASPNSICLVAEISGETAGVCDASLTSNPDDPDYPLYPNKVVNIDDLYVDPKFRRQGVARALLAELKLRAAATGAQSLGLLVWDFNEGARALYESLGMKTTFRRMQLKL